MLGIVCDFELGTGGGAGSVLSLTYLQILVPCGAVPLSPLQMDKGDCVCTQTAFGLIPGGLSIFC